MTVGDQLLNINWMMLVQPNPSSQEYFTGFWRFFRQRLPVPQNAGSS
jgi:hypothetical protein